MDAGESINLPGLPFALSWAEPPAASSVTLDGALAITAGPRTDLFIDLGLAAAPQPIINAPRLVGRVEGDFQLKAHVSVDFRSTFDAGVVIIWADDETWAKLCFEYSPQGEPMIVSVVTRGLSDDCNSFVVRGSDVWLRISRSGPTYAFHASLDGVTWRFVRHFVLGGRPDPGVGFEAQSPTGEGSTATFDQFSFMPESLGNLRDGT